MSSTENKQLQIMRESEKIIGDGEICSQCHCTFNTMGDKCDAPLEVECPGFKYIDKVRRNVAARVYGWKEMKNE